MSVKSACAKDIIKTDSLSYALGNNADLIAHSTSAIIGKLKVSSAIGNETLVSCCCSGLNPRFWWLMCC